MAERFDKFTERARRVLTLAQEEAKMLNHNYLGTEHLLLGLVREGDGVAARVLKDAGLSQDRVRESVKLVTGAGPTKEIHGEIGLTPRARKVIELAVVESRNLNHHYIGTEHLLLALIREEDGVAAGVLSGLGLTLDVTRRMVKEVLSPPAEKPKEEPVPMQTTEMKPYRCPVCGGTGSVPAGFYSSFSGSGVSFTTSSETCHSCGGSGIIWGPTVMSGTHGY